MAQTARTGSEKDTDLSRFWGEIESEGWGANNSYLLFLCLVSIDTSRLLERLEEGLSFREL